jgi:hypothetical protein
MPDDRTPRQEVERQRYLDTLTPISRSRYEQRQYHQFADSIGGCSSNYRF